MPPFSLLLKPTSADCNLRCDYCFYLKKRSLYPETKTHRMSDDVLRAVIRSYMATDQPVYQMTWQGGEPTLMGKAFFEKVVACQKQFARKGSRIANSLQTNAFRITDGLAAHLGRYRFLAGCSLDGPPEMHDQRRRTVGGKPTHARVLDGIRTLRSNRVPVNTLSLITRENAGKPLELYRYLKRQGFAHLQFVPCVEFDDVGDPLPFAIDAKSWGRFLIAVFNEWYERDLGRISVRTFESLLYRLVTGDAAECRLAKRCDRYFVVEYNGDIYPCDFFVDPRFKIGNILEMTWEEARSSEVYQRFAVLKAERNDACGECRYLSFCLGDCLKYRMASGDDPRTLSWLCPGWKRFYDATMDRFKHLAADVVRGGMNGRRGQENERISEEAMPGTEGSKMT